MATFFTQVVNPGQEYDSLLDFLKMWESRGYLVLVKTIPCAAIVEWQWLKPDRNQFWEEYDSLFLDIFDEGPTLRK